MKIPANPWFPWQDTRRVPGAQDKGRILTIIPTAGVDLERVRRCLDSLRMASEDCAIHPVVVLCPATIKRVRAVKEICANRAQLVSLPGPFNYCRSINEGLRQRTPGDGYALFLNDDVTFQCRGDLARLKSTLRTNNWACVGPYITGWHDRFAGKSPSSGSVRTNEPVNGCCALWDLGWMGRLEGLDEEFGRGWGLDEADLCLRAVRRGARYGREDTVTIQHEGHATFGADYTKVDGPAHEHNVKYFRMKHGNQVGLWGQTPHWSPLPGVQVSIAAYNAERWLERSLASVEQALDGFRWSLFIGDDASTDSTYEIARAHLSRTHADVARVRRFSQKAMTVDQAKNRVLRMGAPFRKAYPAMCLMDADDVMAPERVRHLLWRARDGGHLAVSGDYLQIAPQIPEQHNKIIVATAEGQTTTGFGPWATIFHAGLIPSSGKLFREHQSQLSNGDVDLWVRWFRRGIHIAPFPGEVVHHYYWHEGSVSRPSDQGMANLLTQRWQRRRARLLNLPLESATVMAYSTPSPQPQPLQQQEQR